MRTILCTLFGFNYLDKGLVLYESLERVSEDFVLYVLAMDDDCYDYLQSCGYSHMVPIRLSDFENESLLKAKKTRSFGEYCWTCSSSLIKYVLDYFGESACAYVDADMAFYDNPVSLFRELEERGGSVLLTGHRFNRCEKHRASVVGRFCVEFNLFLNRQDAREALDIWINQCLEKCSSKSDNGSFGDQKYLDDWLEKYPFVRETLHLGAGVAPWNVSQYRLVSHRGTPGNYRLRTKRGQVNLIFYHFEGITYLDRHKVDVGLYNYWGIDDRFVRPLYIDYLQTLERHKEQILHDTGNEIFLKSHPAFAVQEFSIRERIQSVARKILSAQGRRLLVGKELPSRLYSSKNIIEF